MKQFAWRITVCLLPVIISIVIVSLAYRQYLQGKGGFRLGVDLAGGTILVYEVDKSRELQGDAEDHKDDPEELAAALKRRIDPGDLHNVTVRPISSSNPPRVEIILPTGGRHQSEIEIANWGKLIEEAKNYPGLAPGITFDDITPGDTGTLTDRILRALPYGTPEHPYSSPEDARKQVNEVSAFVDRFGSDTSGGRGRSFSADEVEDIKNRISQQGRLEFKILANSVDDGQAISNAESQLNGTDILQDLTLRARKGQPPPSPKDKGNEVYQIIVNDVPSQVTYRWVEIGKEELYSLNLNNDAQKGDKKALWDKLANLRDRGGSGKATYRDENYNLLFYSRKIPDLSRLTRRERDQGKQYEYFLLVRDAAMPISQTEVTGQFLSAVGTDRSNKGKLAVSFRFNAEGSRRFGDLTKQNKPSGFHRQLAVILDNQIRSAPSLNAVITDAGIIEGDAFTPRTIDDLVKILKAGALPASLKRDPVSENTIGATLGEDTIRHGTYAVLIAFVAILVFMLVYYRFAGVVACVALLANLLMTVAFMVLVQAAFTLPGLAGLVLMLGMAVDANVLIYERLREERERGANLALAIRNGYDRAFPTIIDTHLSSIFTAIVLFAVGNDQLKGFGISLTVGLIISLFTSLYMTRTMFDVCLSKHWLTQLKMMQLFHRPNIDFMAIRYYWFAATIILTIIGGSLFLMRLDKAGGRATVLNIDFTGGTSFTGVLNNMTDAETLRKDLDNIDLPDLSVEPVFVSDKAYSDGDKSKLFTVRTSERDPKVVQDRISLKLGDKLERAEVRNRLLAFQARNANDKKEVQIRLGTLLSMVKPDTPPEKFSIEVKTFVIPGSPEQSAARELLLLDTFRKELSLNPNRADRTIDFSEDAEKKDGLKLVLTAPMEIGELVKKLKEAQIDKPEECTIPVTKEPDANSSIAADPNTSVVFWASSLDELKLALKDGPKPNVTLDQKDNTITVKEARLFFVNPKAEPGEKPRDIVSAPMVDKVYGDIKVNDDPNAEPIRRFLNIAPLAGYRKGQRFSAAQITMPSMVADTAQEKLDKAGEVFNRNLQPERLENFDAQLAADTQTRALYAILASWAAILLYLWFRFGNWTFGAATVLCLIHDLFFTLGFIAIAHYISATWFGRGLLINDFKIDLASIAALLTLVGYSVNDTIVVFDRIREVRGKSPRLTPQMINDSVNGTLSRTVLASLSVWLVVIVLYLFGGEGVHLFAYVMVVGVVVGTYSSIYIASPLLLIFGEGGGHAAPVTTPTPPKPAAAGPSSTAITTR